MKNILLVILSVLLLTSCDNSENEKQEQIKKFEIKLGKIKEVSPDTLYIFTINKFTNAEPDSPFSKWTPEMIQEQAAYSYRSESKELIGLVVEMLIYKKIVNSNGELSINELVSFVDRVRLNEHDKIDSMIIQTFDLAIQYEQKYLELRPNNFL